MLNCHFCKGIGYLLLTNTAALCRNCFGTGKANAQIWFETTYRFNCTGLADGNGNLLPNESECFNVTMPIAASPIERN